MEELFEHRSHVKVKRRLPPTGKCSVPALVSPASGELGSILLLQVFFTDGKFDSFAMFFAYVSNVCPRSHELYVRQSCVPQGDEWTVFQHQCDEVWVAGVPTPPSDGFPLPHASTYFACTERKFLLAGRYVGVVSARTRGAAAWG